MASEQLDLLAWQPPRQIIPFPGRLRIGHAKKVAGQLSKARSSREADHIVIRTYQAFSNQMERAGIPADEIERQKAGFIIAIRVECERIRSAWVPYIEKADGNNPKGAA